MRSVTRALVVWTAALGMLLVSASVLPANASSGSRSGSRDQEKRAAAFFADWEHDVAEWSSLVATQCTMGNCSRTGLSNLLSASILVVSLNIELEKFKSDATFHFQKLRPPRRRLFDYTESQITALGSASQVAATCATSGAVSCEGDVAYAVDVLTGLKSILAKWKRLAPKEGDKSVTTVPAVTEGRFCSATEEGITSSYLLTQLMCLRLDAEGSRFAWLDRKTMRREIDYALSGVQCAPDRLGFVHATGTLTNLRRGPETFWLGAQVLDFSNVRISEGFDVISNLGAGQAATFSILMSRISTGGNCVMSKVSGSP